jgi:hypothetical protein
MIGEIYFFKDILCKMYVEYCEKKTRLKVMSKIINNVPLY